MIIFLPLVGRMGPRVCVCPVSNIKNKGIYKYIEKGNEK